MDKSKGFIFLAISTLAYGFIHIIDKMVLNEGADAAAYSFFRVAIGAFIVGVFALFTKRDSLKLTVDKRFLKSLILIGVIGMGWRVLFQIMGLEHTTPTNVAVTMMLVAPLTTLFAVLHFKEKLPRHFWRVSIALLLGVYLVLGRGELIIPNFGDALILIAAIGFGYSNAYSKGTLNKLSTTIVTFGSLLFGALSIGILIPVFSFPIGSLLPVLGMALLGGVVFGIRMITFFKGIDLTSASIAAHFILLAPVITAIASSYFLAEQILPMQWLGITIVLIGTYALTKLK